MMRKALQRVPLETGNRWAIYMLCAIVGSILGWILHPATHCWWPVV